MKVCNERSRYTGLYMTYMWRVHVENRVAFSICNDLESVRREWKYWRKKYPNRRMYVHRFLVVAGIDEQMERGKNAIA